MTFGIEWIEEREGVAEDEAEKRWGPLLERLLRETGEAERIGEGVVTLTMTDDAGIRELNRQYRDLDKPTDVLSFPLRETAGDEPPIQYDEADGDPFAAMLGDIVISVPRAEAQAEEYGHSLEREIGFLFVHGLLHLLGYDHADEEQEREMFARQEAILAKAGLTR